MNDESSCADFMQNIVEQCNKESQEMYGKDFDTLSKDDKQWIWDEIMWGTHIKATAEKTGKALNKLTNKLRESIMKQ